MFRTTDAEDDDDKEFTPIADWLLLGFVDVEEEPSARPEVDEEEEEFPASMPEEEEEDCQ